MGVISLHQDVAPIRWRVTTNLDCIRRFAIRVLLSACSYSLANIEHPESQYCLCLCVCDKLQEYFRKRSLRKCTKAILVKKGIVYSSLRRLQER